MPDSIKQEIGVVQNEIYEILCYLQDNFYLEELYDEGYVEDEENYPKFLKESFDTKFWKDFCFSVDSLLNILPEEQRFSIEDEGNRKEKELISG